MIRNMRQSQIEGARIKPSSNPADCNVMLATMMLFSAPIATGQREANPHPSVQWLPALGARAGSQQSHYHRRLGMYRSPRLQSPHQLILQSSRLQCHANDDLVALSAHCERSREVNLATIRRVAASSWRPPARGAKVSMRLTPPSAEQADTMTPVATPRRPSRR
jgi:hypothetical protein